MNNKFSTGSSACDAYRATANNLDELTLEKKLSLMDVMQHLRAVYTPYWTFH